jgi:transcriptional regulator with XRE-family HTH domain
VTISNQLRKAIEKSGKTRYRLSVESGIDQATLSRFIKHGTGLSLANVDKLCECIGAELRFKKPKRR